MSMVRTLKKYYYFDTGLNVIKLLGSQLTNGRTKLERLSLGRPLWSNQLFAEKDRVKHLARDPLKGRLLALPQTLDQTGEASQGQTL